MQKYTFDPIEERIFIKDEYYPNGSLKSSTYYFDDDYIVIQNSSGTYNRTNIYQDGVLVGYEGTDGKKRYVLPDHEGSAHLILNESGDVIEENLFSPFAEPLEGVKENKFSYEAKEYDSLVQDYDFHFRKYCAELGIFCQPDTLLQNVYDPQLLNRYSFERNNPYRYTDPSGHNIPAIVEGISIIADLATIGNYNTLIEINEDPNLEQELIAARNQAWDNFAAGFSISKGLEKLFNPTVGASGSAAMTMGGIKTYYSFEKRVALTNPFSFKEYLDSLSSGNFPSEQQRNQFYTRGGVNLLQLTSSLTLFNRYGGGDSIRSSIQQTSMSGKNIKWYYNTITGSYTWRVGGTKPKGDGWTGGGSNSGGGGGSNSNPGSHGTCKATGNAQCPK